MRQTHPTAEISVWAEDEHRLGLLPVVRRVWAPRGQRPIAAIARHYEWLYVYGFVRPRTGQSWWCLLPTVTTAAFALALATFARDEGIDADHRVVLVLDQAGWHRSPRLAVPEGIHVVFLPSYSPELQPVERLWSLVDEPIANRAFAALDPSRQCSSSAVAPWQPIPSASKPIPTSTGGRQTRSPDTHSE